jgi:[glutamine synthetase] adenylyltransferase / [glutamine synthetase]-adenylyl-L-tyrosine phosphorylase
VLNLLDEIQFRDPVRARPELIYLGKLSPAAVRTVSALLPSLPNPDDSIHFLNRLLAEAPEAGLQIAEHNAALRYALTIFSYSHFLADAVIRRPEWLIEIAVARDLHRGFLAEQYEELLVRALPSNGVPRAVDLALFRRQQLLRIVLRDALRFADLSETIEDLSNLADAILNVTWRGIRNDLQRERFAPPTVDGSDPRFSILALGKLGGRELNYSSDIDLMFICSTENAAAGDSHPGPIEFCKIAATRMTDMLSMYTEEGMCYRVDLRLRPDGRYGEICHSLAGAKQYYASRGRDWELQMLIKARVAAGDLQPGRELLDFVEPLIYRTTTDFGTVEVVSETRARIHERQQRSRPSGADVKLAKGGIRDIEFLVQCLQRLHGGREPWVRHGGTLLALSRLRDKELLSPLEYARLASAYQFLRHLEHRLQFDEDRQTHTLPQNKDQLDLLARKMPAGTPGLPNAGTLERELDHHFSSVRDLYDRVIHAQRPSGIIAPEEPQPAPLRTENARTEIARIENARVENAGPERAEFPSGNLRRYLDQRAPAFAQLIANGGISRSGVLLKNESLESFLEKVVASPAWLETLENNSELARCTLDVFEHSQYFADQLVRHTELLDEVRAACGEKQGRTGFIAPRDPEGLRRFFRQQMVRIQSDSVYHRVSVFKTLKRTSELADSIINAAYEIAVAEANAIAPPVQADYAQSNQMMVIALGRLGMLEFDLASDADLVFVIPDSDAGETLFWTGVAERMIAVISAYTGDGVVFTIDTRLRPNGREGALVQTESAYRDYFENHAEAWEGIAYMKARAVAGDMERATKFLGELQQLDWRRYGQSGRSRAQLAQMRARLEREQGLRNPLKAGPGGYYDIDFSLMYLRLKSAGVFFKVLNTPERIDIVEKMGHLDREDAEFLRGAATFYRAIDHGLRISTGHAEGRLPTNRAQIAILTELVHRWTPASLHDGSLTSVSSRIRQETRAFYERIFGQA